MIETIVKIYGEESLTLLIAAFVDSKELDVDEVEKLSRNEQLDLVAEFAQWSADCIKAQCEKEKERNANG